MKEKQVLTCFSEEEITSTTPPSSEIFYRLLQFLVDDMTYSKTSLRKGFEEAMLEFELDENE